MNNKELLTRQETADFLGVKVQTLANWATTCRHGLKHVKVGRSVRYRRSDIEKFIESRTVGGTKTA